jgi:cellulose synthase/poly-beta-1,6-N-acetylglucosamine synthase-like glycosyltransferase
MAAYFGHSVAVAKISRQNNTRRIKLRRLTFFWAPPTRGKISNTQAMPAASIYIYIYIYIAAAIVTLENKQKVAIKLVLYSNLRAER